MNPKIKKYFKNKKITIMGLGLLGRGVGVTKFLAEMEARLTITDLKNEGLLKSSLKKLVGYKNIEYTLGRHDLKDFKNQDMVIKAAGVPLDSPFVEEAHKNRVPVEMDASLFAKLTDSTIIGVTGTRGKSTTAYLIYEILKKSGKRVFIAGNIKDTATLPLLAKAKQKDIVVLELDSWQLQGFGDSKISPHIAVFTNLLPDHMNYYKGDMQKYLHDKANIFKYQTKNDFLILGENVSLAIKNFYRHPIKSRVMNSSAKNVPRNWLIKLKGEHNKANISCAIQVGLCLKIDLNTIRKGVENFKELPGRLELVRRYRGIEIYNDTNSTTPNAVVAGIKALARNKNIILILGGTDKKLDTDQLIAQVPKYCKHLVLIPGTGTDKLELKHDLPVTRTKNLKEAVEKSLAVSQRGDIILFSPGFASFGMFKNEYDRGDKFIRIVKNLPNA